MFVHGWSCDRTYWNGQVGHFAERHRVVTLDLAGHGESGAGRGRWTMAAFGDDVVAVVDELELDDVVLVGHSMGGDVIVEAGVRLTGRVSGLVWVDTYHTLGKRKTREELDAFVAPFRRDFVGSTREFVRERLLPRSEPDLVEWVAADMSSAPPEIALEAMEHAIGNDGAVLERLREFTAPVSAINSDDRPSDIESLRVHGVRTVVIPGDHFPMLEDRDGFNRGLGKVVDSLAAED